MYFLQVSRNIKIGRHIRHGIQNKYKTVQRGTAHLCKINDIFIDKMVPELRIIHHRSKILSGNIFALYLRQFLCAARDHLDFMFYISLCFHSSYNGDYIISASF